jgi:hypothetical protein
MREPAPAVENRAERPTARPSTVEPATAAEPMPAPAPVQEPPEFTTDDGRTYEPRADACVGIDSPIAPLAAGAEIIPLVRDNGNHLYALAGRTNLPNGTLVFGGLEGFGGSRLEHLRVRNGCFHGPWAEVPPGHYALTVEISGFEGAMTKELTAQLGDDGAKLRGRHMVRKYGRKAFSFRERVVIGAPDIAAKLERERRGIPARVEALITELIAAGRAMEPMRQTAASPGPHDQPAMEAVMSASKECGARMRKYQPRALNDLDFTSGFPNVVNRAAIGEIADVMLADCVCCNVAIALRGCNRAEAQLRNRNTWIQSDPLAGLDE